ncbi:FecR domain-containing protein [Paucibacter sp. O1-1]|nr:FecR domain-containing protein [Paucibacter sp. O1-1]MDA3826964.1 FecR domain-containing protein [Paucibacter sp. O1-1]
MRTEGEALAAQAADWLVRLSVDDATERQQAASGFERWKQQDPRHAQAAAAMEGLLARMQGLREAGAARPARAALGVVASSRGRGKPGSKRGGSAALLALLMGIGAWLGLQAFPPEILLADLRTGTGQWQTHTLADGSRLSLGSDTAVALHDSAQQRGIELLRGEILLDVAKDPNRPLVVSTAEGRMRALGTRLLVRRDAQGTELTMLESRVAASRAGEGRMVTVHAGQRLRLTPAGMGAPQAVEPGSIEEAWQRRRLVVQDRPLPEVLDELARHRPGLMRFDRAALAGIRVSAVLPLDDTGRALQLLQTSFPQLRVQTLSPYLLWVGVAAP